MSILLSLECDWCGKKYQAQRKSSKFCSANCRVASSRYNPVDLYNEYGAIAASNLRKLHELAKKHPELSPEIDEHFNALKNIINEYQFGENYKRVVDEQNRRLV